MRNYSQRLKLMIKISITTILILPLLILIGCSKLTDSQENNPSENNVEVSKENISFQVSEDEIMKTISDIAKEPRALGTEGEKKVAKYLKDKMESYNYNVEYQDLEVFDLGDEARRLFVSDDLDTFFNINPINSTDTKGIARNVIVKTKDYNENKKTLYIFSHYDTTKKTTGVYDNATGVSAVAEVARVLQKENLEDFNIVFAFFSAEEYFRMGSRYFLGQLSDIERENILGAINIDMIGYTGYESKGETEEESISVGNIEINLNSWVKKDSLEVLFNEKFDNKYCVNNKFGGMSDDLPFSRLGVPTLYFADKNFFTGFEIEKEAYEIQVEPVKSSTIADLSEDIASFIKTADIKRFNEIKMIIE